MNSRIVKFKCNACNPFFTLKGVAMTKKISLEYFDASLKINPFINEHTKVYFHEYECVLCGRTRHEGQMHKKFDRLPQVLPREIKPKGICKECFFSDPE